MIEVWKDIPGYENIYQVSNYGNVRSLDRFVIDKNRKYLLRGKELKKNMRNGYYTIGFKVNNNRKSFQIHRLVAMFFLENKNNYKIVNHKDENPLNNRVDNLEWCTQKHNVNHSKHKMYKMKNNKLSYKTNEKYINIKRNKYRVAIKQLEYEKYFDTLKEAIINRNYMLKVLEQYYLHLD